MQEYLLFNLNYDSLRLLLIIIGVLLGFGIFLVIILLRRRQPVKVVHPPTIQHVLIELYPECPECGRDTSDAGVVCKKCRASIVREYKEIRVEDLKQYEFVPPAMEGMFRVKGLPSNYYLATQITNSETGESKLIM